MTAQSEVPALGAAEPRAQNDLVARLLALVARRRDLGAVPVVLFMLTFAVGPLVLVFFWSFLRQQGIWVAYEFTLENYRLLFTTERLPVILRTIQFAAITTGIALLIGYPAAYFFARICSPRAKAILMAVFTVPFIVSPLIRLFALRFVLGSQGLINVVAIGLGLVKEPMAFLLFTDFSVYVGLLISYAPFALFPIWLALEGIDSRVLEASADLGARPWQTLWHVILPLSMPGVFTGSMFVFVSVMGEMAASLVLAGAGRVLIGNMLMNVIDAVNYPLAAAIASLVIIFLAVLVLLGQRLLGIGTLFTPFRR